jgi:hypothetical protein
MLRTDVRFLASASLLCFSTYFITKILSISPVYFAIACSLLFFSLDLLYKPFRRRVSWYSFARYAPFFLYGCYIIVLSLIKGSEIKQPVLIALSILLYIFALLIYRNERIKVITKISKAFLLFAFLLFVVDAAYRLTHPSTLAWRYTQSDFFYMFKFNSIMFHDSNEVGFAILIILSFMIYLSDKRILKIGKLYFVLFFVLLILSFSRAAILSFILTIFYYHHYRNRGQAAKLFIGISVLVLIFVLLMNFRGEDYSLSTKYDIWRRAYDYFNRCTIEQFVFGNGYGNSTYQLGMYAHVHILVQMIEFGVIGTVLYMAIFLVIISDNRDTLHLLIPYAIAGFAYAPLVVPYFFIINGLIASYCPSSNRCIE